MCGNISFKIFFLLRSNSPSLSLFLYFFFELKRKTNFHQFRICFTISIIKLKKILKKQKQIPLDVLYFEFKKNQQKKKKKSFLMILSRHAVQTTKQFPFPCTWNREKNKNYCTAREITHTYAGTFVTLRLNDWWFNITSQHSTTLHNTTLYLRYGIHKRLCVK